MIVSDKRKRPSVNETIKELLLIIKKISLKNFEQANLLIKHFDSLSKENIKLSKRHPYLNEKWQYFENNFK